MVSHSPFCCRFFFRRQSLQWLGSLGVWVLTLPAVATAAQEELLPPLEHAEVDPSGPVTSDGMFLPARDGGKLWDRTLRTIAADWPVVRTIPPDFAAIPPRAGRIESAWVEPPAKTTVSGLPANSAWAPQRQWVVVQVLPAAGGVWIDAVVETQSLADLDTSLMPDRVTLTGGWETDMRGQR